MTLVLDPLPPRDAIAAFIERGHRLDPSFAWEDVYADLHASMFTVARSAGHDVLEGIHRALLAALEEGQTVEQFSRNLKPLLVEKGWWGSAVEIDPQTGQETAVRLGSLSRLKLIYDVNMRVSYATGKWQRFERVKAARPFLRYVAILDERTRPHHAALHNLVLPVDHPFWNTHAAPNGWFCRCTMQSLSQRDVDRLIAAGEPLRFDAPEFQFRTWTNKRTGETRQVPVGIDPGWDYNAGKAGHDVIARQAGENAGRPIGG